ncbi:hypothetical protein CDLVIII_5132 [Clostridium sp. DL-VIII]|uniref:hypothetical protein n=1 Tax=Clostridium sp. DL-VIII TaxID=641107 RepID=UPI00023B0780|nr:hypothetical protein [Clostridium sp. DL-VIII]EHJ01623.1 hypothetical protein CDLVIII_5132 [Clostridium sp. DL-VIII]
MNIISCKKIIFDILLTSSLLITTSMTVFAETNNNLIKETNIIQDLTQTNENKIDSSLIITTKTSNFSNINNTFPIIKTGINSSSSQNEDSKENSTENKYTTSESKASIIKIVAGIVILILAMISILAYLNLDKNKFKDYFKK